MLTVGNGPKTFEFTLSRLVEEQVKVQVKARNEDHAKTLLFDHEPDLEGWWETYDKSVLEVEAVRKKR